MNKLPDAVVARIFRFSGGYPLKDVFTPRDPLYPLARRELYRSIKVPARSRGSPCPFPEQYRDCVESLEFTYWSRVELFPVNIDAYTHLSTLEVFENKHRASGIQGLLQSGLHIPTMTDLAFWNCVSFSFIHSHHRQLHSLSIMGISLARILLDGAGRVFPSNWLPNLHTLLVDDDTVSTFKHLRTEIAQPINGLRTLHLVVRRHYSSMSLEIFLNMMVSKLDSVVLVCCSRDPEYTHKACLLQFADGVSQFPVLRTLTEFSYLVAPYHTTPDEYVSGLAVSIYGIRAYNSLTLKRISIHYQHSPHRPLPGWLTPQHEHQFFRSIFGAYRGNALSFRILDGTRTFLNRSTWDGPEWNKLYIPELRP
ncbi:hypothetical protein NP233_g3625 [Leucocoprinus birnbaumii]|uniref:Uncharacterized protein n=1 Tax=Leucocoprinus birnbaumii TaxID=56174 RepID=A0AAD5VYU1_9AGAR|nr:hypothetical protein NP233_g3625 [Leucocoprinus birnbaumii]